MSGRDGLISPDSAGIARAADTIKEGGLVAMPTETVYGLAGRADRAETVAAIYRAKGRPSFNPLIVHVASLDMARALAEFSPLALELAGMYWPGPLTLVLPLRPEAAIAGAVTAGLPTIALRIPAHPVARALLEETALPLAAPSANRSNGISPTRPEHVAASLREAAPPILDGGPCESGLESTIIAVDDGWRLLRPGPVGEDELARQFGPPAKSRGATIEAPGQLAKHYSPGKPVRLDAREAEPGEFFIGFGDIPGDFSLSFAGDLAQAASRLYEALHRGAAASQGKIAIAPIPQTGMGAAINDRLRRAAAS
ncbi:L-threonylcarbamoyladenylate synthase [Aurantiacibacter gangjinensis]|uniref:Threonylcarbamoyl-AMP synthase n=1 Tax=Aurantiacibacter gangjinensis TaxID=502682 RepID=A0A0G9MLJ6_9SPHN|nr:L-threonylcarbamoyladenylate synthase [Aurantiacibacter gangjinensis]APE27528.1 TsaC protein (YrdC-Sua5 domains) required for threonylcarbamoyladenosine t(6)A37 modification in tRNA [Aurantiacibacter gangjinensis]KLE31580.1 translation factor Sua5 [Aurantiacibacter gangjinensis]